MTGRRALASDGGFTLIEALVALAIGGFVIATLAGITGQWIRGWRAGFPMIQRSELLAASLDRIAADLSAARLVPAGTGGPGIIFKADAGSITFVRRTLPVEAPAGLELVRLAPLTGSSDVTLARSRSLLPVGAALDTPADAAPVVLLRPPYAVRFSYADADQKWQSTWAAAARLPRLIRVELTDRRTGRGAMAPVVVRVQVEAPLACATMTAAKTCDGAMGLAGGGPSEPADPGDQAGRGDAGPGSLASRQH